MQPSVGTKAASDTSKELKETTDQQIILAGQETADQCSAMPMRNASDSDAKGSGSDCTTWLLGALFHCQSSVARGLVVRLVTRLVQRVASSGDVGVQHAAHFVRDLLSIGLAHATTYWGDAQPFCDLIRCLVALPPPLHTRLAQSAWLENDAVAKLIAYIIGQATLMLPTSLGELLVSYPRPQRGAQPIRSTAEMGNNEGTALLLEPIAGLLDTEAACAALKHAATTPRQGDGTGLPDAGSTEDSTQQAAADAPYAVDGRTDHQSEALLEAVVIEVEDASMQRRGGSAGSPLPSLGPGPKISDLICSAAFVSSAVSAYARAGSSSMTELSDPLLRCVERGCRHSSERAGIVLREALRGLRSDGELAAGLCAQLLLHLLGRCGDDERVADERRRIALSKEEGGLHALLAELLKDDGTTAEVPRKEDAARKEEEDRTPWTESTRCYLCITTLLEVHTMSTESGAWLEDSLGVDEVELMLRWLKDASRTAALGKQVESRARLLGLRRRGGWERTESQQTTLEQLRSLSRAVSAKVKARARYG